MYGSLPAQGRRLSLVCVLAALLAAALVQAQRPDKGIWVHYISHERVDFTVWFDGIQEVVVVPESSLAGYSNTKYEEAFRITLDNLVPTRFSAPYLKPDTAYQVQIRQVGHAGNVHVRAAFQTLPAPASTTTWSIRAEGVTSNSATVTWDPAPSRYWYHHYWFEVDIWEGSSRLDRSQARSRHYHGWPGGVSRLPLSNLRPGTGYTITVTRQVADIRPGETVPADGSSASVSFSTLAAQMSESQQQNNQQQNQLQSQQKDQQQNQQQSQQPQIDAGLLAEIEAKIARHRDETGRTDLAAGFTAARDGLKGNISPQAALAALDSGWQNDLWRRIRAALNALS